MCAGTSVADLHHDQRIPGLHEQVQLAQAAAVVRRHALEPGVLEVAAGQFLGAVA